MESAMFLGDTAGAMSEESVEVVRSVYEAWGRDDLPGPAHFFDE
jgi:hypothetical protein